MLLARTPPRARVCVCLCAFCVCFVCVYFSGQYISLPCFAPRLRYVRRHARAAVTCRWNQVFVCLRLVCVILALSSYIRNPYHTSLAAFFSQAAEDLAEELVKDFAARVKKEAQRTTRERRSSDE